MKKGIFYKATRRCVTLIEMMIVMFLIAMIIGVIAYNYQGSLEEGKAFKSKAGIEKIKTILLLRISQEPESISDVEAKWRDYVRESPLVQNSEALIKDGWGKEYIVSVREDNEEAVIEVYSKSYDKYQKNHKTLFKEH